MTKSAPGRPVDSSAGTVSSIAADRGKSSSRLHAPAFVLLNLMAIWLVVGQSVPGVNEAHYLPKAKHVFDPDFAARDLFIASGNAHWLFSLIAGSLTKYFSLEVTAWIGRVLSWTWVAAAWLLLTDSLRIRRVFSPFALCGWLLAVHWGNWSGEWAVGGFEGKSLAYPAVLMALAYLVQERFKAVWFWSAVAIAFHPLVGLWAGGSMWAAWFLWGRNTPTGRGQVLSQFGAFLISLTGLVPAVLMLGGPSRVGPVVTAQIHPFFRLAHHQTPHLFRWEQHVAGATTFGLFLTCTIALWLVRPAGSSGKSYLFCLMRRALFLRWETKDESPRLRSSAWLVRVGWIAVLISAVGLAIDLCLVPVRPAMAAGLLRFYWFRWFDIVVPLAWVAVLWAVIEEWASAVPQADPVDNDPGRRAWKQHAAGVACLLTMVFVGKQLTGSFNDRTASADRPNMMLDSPTLKRGLEAVDDWRAVCKWISENTPRDALFFTPRAQQTFKWYAGRAEVVSYKDVPQDGPSLLIWFDRIERCAPPRVWDKETRLPVGDPLPWKTEQLKQFQKRYGFEYVVVDLRVQREPPLLEVVYPLGGHVNETYAVFRMPPMTH